MSFFLGCKSNLNNNEEFIQNLSNETSYELPFINESLLIFIKKDKKIFITRLRLLHEMYIKDFTDKGSFDDFLIKVINKDLLNQNQLNEVSLDSVSENEDITNVYRKKGINNLIRMYCNRSSKEGKFYIKQNLNLDEQFNIMYYFFKNNYYIMNNDVEGRYVVIDKN